MLQLLYHIYNKGLIEECGKDENLEVNGPAATSYLNRRL